MVGTLNEAIGIPQTSTATITQTAQQLTEFSTPSSAATPEATPTALVPIPTVNLVGPALSLINAAN